MAIRTIRTEDFFGEPANFEIIWETVCMTCTFAVGIQTDKQNERLFKQPLLTGRPGLFKQLFSKFFQKPIDF